MYGYKILEFLTCMPVFALSTIEYVTNCIPTKFLKQSQNRTASSLSYYDNTTHTLQWTSEPMEAYVNITLK
jgi:hypothetical protein